MNTGIKTKNLFASQKLAPYIFVSPFIITFVVFFAYPIFSTIMMSFQKIEGIGSGTFTGLSNYTALMGDTKFHSALKTNTIYTLLTLLVLIPLPMFLAVLLNSRFMAGRSFFRSALFIPALTSVIVAGIFFRYAFGDQETTLFNSILGNFGIAPQAWLQNGVSGMLILVLIATWRWMGVNIIYFLSGLQSIPAEQYESADIDGANAWDKFIRITIPGLKPVIIYVLTISIYGGYVMFAESYVLWTNMFGDIGLTIVRYIYELAFNLGYMGLAAALGVALLVIIMTVNMIQLAFFGLFRKESD